MSIRIYHNPRCSKSRATLALLNEHGIDPEVVAYLENPPSADNILKLAEQLGLNVRDLLRTGEDDYRAAAETLDFDDDKSLAGWLAAHPRVLQRPIVVDTAAGRAVIGRPPENVLELCR